jgi:hypothetical protein
VAEHERRLCRFAARSTQAFALNPSLDDAMQLLHPIGQRGRTRLQDDRRFHLVQFTVAHRGHVLPSGPSRHCAPLNFLPHHDPKMMSGARRAVPDHRR